MSDIIELVIKLPEDEYQNILLTGKASFCTVNAIEAGTLLPKRLLEQEPVLNKIRDEIEQLPITDTAIRLVTEIIDKYKTESEK